MFIAIEPKYRRKQGGWEFTGCLCGCKSPAFVRLGRIQLSRNRPIPSSFFNVPFHGFCFQICMNYFLLLNINVLSRKGGSVGLVRIFPATIYCCCGTEANANSQHIKSRSRWAQNVTLEMLGGYRLKLNRSRHPLLSGGALPHSCPSLPPPCPLLPSAGQRGSLFLEQ